MGFLISSISNTDNAQIRIVGRSWQRLEERQQEALILEYRIFLKLDK